MMNHRNPYRNSLVLSSQPVQDHVPRATWKWVLGGCLCGAVIPIAFSAYLFHRDSVYLASLPPGSGPCGIMLLGALIGKVLIIVVGAPLGGLLGSLVGWLASKLRF